MTGSMVRRRSVVSRVLVHMVLTIAVVLAVFPLFWVAMTSMKTNREATAPITSAFDFIPTASNFIAIFQSPTFLSSLWASVSMTAAATLIVAVLATLGGYGFARARIPGRGLLISVMVLVQVIPGIVLVIPLFRIVSAMGMYDQWLPMVLVMVGLTLPFATWLMLAFIRSSPVEIEEAALVDGVNRLQLFRHVVIPMALPGIATASIFTAINVWNSFLIPIVLGQSRMQTLTVFVARFVTYQQVEWGYLCAAAVLILTPIVVFVLALQRPLVRGITAGAGK